MSSSNNFDAVRNRVVPQRQHSVDEVQRLFGKGSNATLANEVFRTNRAYYESVRRQAVADNVIDGPREHSWAAHYRAKAAAETPRQLSDDEVRAVAEFSKEACERYLHQSGNSGEHDNLSNMPPERYRVFRRSCVAHGLLQERPTQPDKPTPLLEQLAEPDGMIQVGAALCQKLNLPEGYRCPPERLSQLVQLAAEIELTRQQKERELRTEADKATVEGDKQ